MKRVIKFVGILLVILFLSTSFSFQKEAKASPISCGIRSVNSFSILDDGISLLCSGNGTWGAIRATATFTNSTAKINNYNNTGGYARALEHFNKMPGNAVTRADGTKTKSAEGKTVTLYKSTSTLQPSLSYPNGSKTDKIRYY